ncbi:hypothetical protein Lalb_Chr24g0402601 [Lupinus albus]|uniref:Uncharacterized protein n=1 Tax=Lupinus albus TaxID=3870 RepID=A0A6A4N570_LUPAL|nr:hypothetical protein Lalb_Chr24g0402601 [Lupinus albus]
MIISLYLYRGHCPPLTKFTLHILYLTSTFYEKHVLLKLFSTFIVSHLIHLSSLSLSQY